ncbi:sigma-70 family RNA polymerase sigma factor [Phenylobacterium sp.]|uniref:sigma-70 family RNA polymerase sigma factor n=1 Tax=Phenylobacterium sp. TaxID=1871053 RepID=UPI002CB955E8|nr:sigma-70 family RNA polymerase sigma factor [Phenylobacterium sp.]HVI30578.1 sigma-70 family RNA polymerase sigma factor [Phenylobacterium sp.]
MMTPATAPAEVPGRVEPPRADLQAEAPSWSLQELRTLRPALRAYALSLVGSVADADDLVQDALLKAWRYRSSYAPGSNLKGWLFRILRNEFITFAGRPRPVEDIDGRYAAQLRAPERGELSVVVEEVLAALDTLPEISREALVHVALGDSHEEIAAICGCQVGSVKSRVSRARARLIKALQVREGPVRTCKGCAVRSSRPARPR